MEFWIIWLIGIAIVICTRIAISLLSRHPNIYNNKAIKITITLLIIICIVIVGGIAVGKWIGNFADFNCSDFTTADIVFAGATTVIAAVLTYGVGYWVLNLQYFKEEKWLQRLFVVVFIVSIIGWSIPICQYNRNIETTTQTVVKSQKKRKLLYFCNIPVQEISGTISGSSILGSGQISGQITTSDNLPYWYLDGNGEGAFDSVPATKSKIVFIDDNQSPYVEIVVYSTQKISKNNNNGTEKTTIEGTTWTEYKFYLPKAIMQYNLN